MPAPHEQPQKDEQTGGIGRMLLGVLIIITVMIVSTVLLVPRLIAAPFRRQPTRPDGYGERPLATPPDAATVARRARLLALQLRHLTVAATELAAAHGDERSADQRAAHDARARALDTDIAATLASAPDTAEATRDELHFLRKRPTRVTRSDALDVSWRAESLAVLLWALGRLDALPPFDTQADPEPLLALADRLVAEGAAPTLRVPAEVERMQACAKLWHWRSRTRQLEEDGTPLPEGLPVTSYEEIVRLTTDAAQQDGMLDAVRDGDFKAMGKGFRWLTSDEWSSVQSIIVERHRALNWLCGYAPANRWDDVPTHT